MSPDALATTDPRAGSTSLCAKLTNVLVSPGDVLDEVVDAPPRLSNWLVPTLLVWLTGTLLLDVATNSGQTSSGVGSLVDVGMASAAQTQRLSGGRQLVFPLAAGLSVVVGTFWAALVLWFIGRVFLKTRFAFVKALEVVGLAGMILALGSLVTALLILASGNPSARPALSLLVLQADPSHRFRALLEMLNFFHLWSTTVLAVGLSRLSGVSLGESSFWVFGYWGLARIGLILLA